MQFFSYMFKLLGTIISVYAFICVIRIFLTWIPSAEYSSFGTFVKQLCDPWLNLFKKWNPIKNSGMDISPIIAIGILYILSAVFKQIAFAQKISFGIIFAIIIQMSWSIISSVITIFNIVVFLRLLAHIFNWTNGFWYNLEHAINPIASWIRIHIFNNKFVKQSTLWLITFGAGLIIQLGGNVLIRLLVLQIAKIPF